MEATQQTSKCSFKVWLLLVADMLRTPFKQTEARKQDQYCSERTWLSACSLLLEDASNVAMPPADYSVAYKDSWRRTRYIKCDMVEKLDEIEEQSSDLTHIFNAVNSVMWYLRYFLYEKANTTSTVSVPELEIVIEESRYVVQEWVQRIWEMEEEEFLGEYKEALETMQALQPKVKSRSQ